MSIRKTTEEKIDLRSVIFTEKAVLYLQKSCKNREVMINETSDKTTQLLAIQNAN